jgi:hypothetical protein
VPKSIKTSFGMNWILQYRFINLGTGPLFALLVAFDSGRLEVEIARELKKNGVNIYIIVASTGLTKEEIENL